MIVSYQWLQTYFKEPLPAPAQVADVLTMGGFEVESFEEKGTDTVFDIKTLADRNTYILSHRYLALELGVLLKRDVAMPEYADSAEGAVTTALTVSIDDADFCHRYVGRVVEGVTNGPSPAWLKERLEVLGQRSINLIVDIANFVMLDTGQPLHAFDADKVQGGLHVRRAHAGEEITLLDGSVQKLNPDIFVIADDSAALAIAGVKGGKKAEVTASTTRIIIEAATFNGPAVRRAAQAVNIRNDSTKRFENQLTPERTLLAMTEMSALLARESAGAVFGPVVDEYKKQASPLTLDIRIADISSRLGITIPDADIVDILTRCQLGVTTEGDMLHLTIPAYRLDLQYTEDVVDEVGRIYGYDKVSGIVPTDVSIRSVNKNFYYHNLIRKTLVEAGFSEVRTYTLLDKGDVALQNPFNVHRGFMRNDLTQTLAEKLDQNIRYADLLGLSEIKIFEIGNVFGGSADGSTEKTSLAFAIGFSKTPKGFDINKALADVAARLDAATGSTAFQTQMTIKGAVAEIALAPCIDGLPDPITDIEFPPLPSTRYKPVSPYPFAVRDIAVFVPGAQSPEQQNAVLNIIGAEAGELLVRTTLFDVFTKTAADTGEVKTSYAYRLVFQSMDRTLGEDDLNSTMQRITEKMNAQAGWQVR